MKWFKKKDKPTLRVMIIEPNSKPEIRFIENSLQGVDAIMGYYKFLHVISNTKLRVMFVPKPLNKDMPQTALIDDIVYKGTLIVHSSRNESGETFSSSLSDDEIEFLTDHIKLLD